MTPTGSEQLRTAGKFYTRAAYQPERKQKLTVISGPRLQSNIKELKQTRCR